MNIIMKYFTEEESNNLITKEEFDSLNKEINTALLSICSSTPKRSNIVCIDKDYFSNIYYLICNILNLDHKNNPSINVAIYNIEIIKLTNDTKKDMMKIISASNKIFAISYLHSIILFQNNDYFYLILIHEHKINKHNEYFVSLIRMIKTDENNSDDYYYKLQMDISL